MSKRITINIDADTPGFGQSSEPVPEGTYEVLIEDVTLVESKSAKNAGKPMYSIRFRIQDEGEAKNRALFTNVCLWPEAAISLLQLLDAIGEPVTQAGKLEVPEERYLMGKDLRVKVVHEEYNGGMQARVKRMMPPLSSAPKPKTRVAFGAKK